MSVLHEEGELATHGNYGCVFLHSAFREENQVQGTDGVTGVWLGSPSESRQREEAYSLALWRVSLLSFAK